MSQTFVAETVANFKQDNINQMTDLNTLRSNFSGTIFPTDAVAGQTCYRTDENKEYQFNGTTWVESNSNSTIAKEVELSKGTLESVSDRLDVSLNKDGTLKTNIVANISEFIISPLTVSFVSATSFTVSDNQTSVFTANRKLMMQLATDYVYSNVLSSVYDSETNKTTVTIKDSVLTSEFQKVAYSVIQKTDAKSIVNVPNGNVSSTTIQDAINELDNEKLGINDNAVSASKLAVAKKINNVPFDGSTDIKINSSTPGIKDYIVSGLKFGTPDGFNLPIQAGEANVNGTDAITVDQTLTTSPRKKNLVYLKSDGAVDKLEAKYPTDYIDDNTVGFWIFNKEPAVAVPNSAVGLSSIAVANDLTPSGTFTRADGLADYAIKGDGTTCTYTAANVTGFPTGTAEWEVDMLYEVGVLTSNKTTWFLGTASGASGAQMQMVNGVVYVGGFSSLANTTYSLTQGKLEHFVAQGDGTNVYLYAGGHLVYSGAFALNIVAGLFRLFSNPSNQYYENGTIHYVEVRNKRRSSQQIAEIAAKLLFPVSYDKSEAAYPIISAADKALAWHEYKCDETSGTTVGDTAGTLNGVATGTTIVDSELGLGKARKLASTADYIILSSFQFSPSWTIIGVAKVNTAGTYNTIFDNRDYSGANGLYVSFNSAGKLVLGTGGNIVSNSATGVGTNNFFALSSDAGSVSMYLNAKERDSVQTFATNTTANSAFIGKDCQGNNPLLGTLDYLLIIPRALSQMEIAEIYDALMNKSRKSLKDQLPADSISLGYAYAGSNGISDINDSWWGYGRREKAYGGNRVVTMDYKPVVASNADSMQWKPPFGGGAKFRTDWISSEKSTDMNVLVCPSYCGVPGGCVYGVFTTLYKNGKIGAYVGANGSVAINVAWRTGGYLRPIFTCLEDD